MRLVDIAENHPGVCLATRAHTGPFVDFECYTTDVDPHVYLSAAVVKQAAEMMGMIPPEDVDSLIQRVRDLEKKYENLYRFAEAAQKTAEAEAEMKGLVPA